jgi:hypothetical protein
MGLRRSRHRQPWVLATVVFALLFWGAGCAGTRKLPARGDGGNDGQLVFADSGGDTSWLPGQDGPGGDAVIAISDGPQVTIDGPKPKPDGPKPKLDQGPPCPGGCDDGNACTVDSCQNNSCKHTAKNCNDGDGCTSDSCDSTSGSCIYKPINCDDKNPCTIDSCSNNNCSYAKSPLVVYRFYNASTGAHSYRTTTAAAPGFKLESPVWRALPTSGAGRAKVYRQVRNASGDHMLSLSSSEGVACCGYTNNGDVGYALTSKSGTAIPVYRLYQASQALHLSSTSSSEGTQLGYKLEFKAFYVCPH